jgi:hypothetical protein
MPAILRGVPSIPHIYRVWKENQQTLLGRGKTSGGCKTYTDSYFPTDSKDLDYMAEGYPTNFPAATPTRPSIGTTPRTMA